MSTPQEAAGLLRRISITAAAVEAADNAAPMIRAAFTVYTPVVSGRLSASISYRRMMGYLGSLVTMLFQTPVGYAPDVVGPTRAHRITATAARSLRWTDSTGEHFAKSVWHPAYAGNPFPKKVADATIPTVRDRFRDALGDQARLVGAP